MYRRDDFNHSINTSLNTTTSHQSRSKRPSLATSLCVLALSGLGQIASAEMPSEAPPIPQTQQAAPMSDAPISDAGPSAETQQERFTIADNFFQHFFSVDDHRA